MKKENLEEAIGSKILELESYNFLSPKSMYESQKTIEDEFEKVSFEKVKDLILLLRKRRIFVFKTLLKDFKKNKDKYLDFLKKQDYSYY